MMDPVFLIDGYSIIYRSFFAFLRKPLRNPEGRNSSAVFGFMRFLFRLKNRMEPRRLAVAMDSLTPTFRHSRYPEYKATREQTPEDLHAQIPVIEDLLEALGISSVRINGFEADDIIAALSERCRRENIPCYILSGDKDLLQLVGGSVKILWPGKGGQDFTEWGVREVVENRGVRPDQIVDYLALTGDSSDNVPGVPGIGDKTAVQLLGEHGSLESIYENIESISGESRRRKLEEGRESALLSRDLVELRRDLPVEDILKALELRETDRPRALELLHREGIKIFDEELGGGAGTDLERLEAGAYHCVTDEPELDRWIKRAQKAGTFAFDSETDGLDEISSRPIGFSLAVAPGEACYIPVKTGRGEMCLPEQLVRDKLTLLLSDRNLTLVGQNVKFDYKILKAWGVTCGNAVFDTMVAAWLLDTARSSYSLDKLAEDLLDYRTVHYSEVAGRNGSLLDADLDQVTDYAAEDADIALRLYQDLEKRLKKEGLLSLFNECEMPNVRILAEMELAGIRLDPARLEDFSGELDTDLAAIEQGIYASCGREFNINSTKQLRQVLFEERKLAPIKKTKGGAISTDAQVLEELAVEDEVCAAILRHRTLSKLKSTYVDSLPRLIHPETGRLHTHYLQTGTATGRLSSKDPNLQNIPVREAVGRRIRAAFVADPGCLFLSADYSQIELVVLAALSGDAVLRKAFQEDRDVHVQTAALLFGVDEAAVSPEMRRIGKTINFGVIYGMSAFRLARDLKLPRKDAETFIRIYFERYQGVEKFIRKTVGEAEERGYVQTILGRKRRLPRINSRNRTEKNAEERIAVNTPIQGSAADIVKMAMIRVTEALAAKPLRSKLLLQVHDELIFEVPREELDAASELIRRAMEGAVELDPPLRVNLEHGESWGDIH